MSWHRTPYHHAARIKGAGVDCGMILAEVYHNAGIVKERIEPAAYVADWHMHRDSPVYLKTLETYATRVEDPDYVPQPGDIAMYRYGRQPAHGAIVIAWPEVIHAYMSAGMVVLDNAVANYDLASRFVGIWSPWAERRSQQ